MVNMVAASFADAATSVTRPLSSAGLPSRRQEGWSYDSSTETFSKPTETILTTNEKITALDIEYQPQFMEIQLAWAAASLQGETTTATSISIDYAALIAEYKTKLEAIESGS